MTNETSVRKLFCHSSSIATKVLSVCACVYVSSAFSAPSTSTHVQSKIKDTLSVFTGGAHVRMVWLQSRLLNDAGASAAPDVGSVEEYLFNMPGSQIVAYDSDDTTGHFIDATLKVRNIPLITRDGKYVIWTELAATSSNTGKVQIATWNGASITTLMNGPTCHVLCLQFDSTTSTQWVYIGDMNNNGKTTMLDASTVYRYKLTGATLDATSKQTVWSQNVEAPFTVTANGLHAATSTPAWNTIAILSLPDVASDEISERIEGSGYACHEVIAPDNSLLNLHLEDDHTTFYIDSNTTYLRKITVSTKMPGNIGTWDCTAPRWTNNKRYVTGGYPYNNTGWFINNPAQNVANLAPGSSGEFCLGKFNSTFTDISFKRITDMSKQFRKCLGDAWIDPTIPVGVLSNPARASAATGMPSVKILPTRISVDLRGYGDSRLTLTTLNGQVAAIGGSDRDGRICLSTARLARGSYVARISSQNGASWESRITLSR